MRLFVAVQISEEVRQKLGTFKNEFTRSLDFLKKVNWVKSENLHLTLKFFGETEETRFESLRSALQSSVIGTEVFEIELRGIGCFPSLSKPRVIWAGMAQGAEELKRIADKIEKNTTAAGFALADKPFSPHLTLARFSGGGNPPPNDFSKKVVSYNSFVFGKTTVSKMVLIQSMLSPAGPHYSVLEEFPFPCN